MSAVFVRVDNALKRRAERAPGVTIEEMLKAADQVLEVHSANGRDHMLAAIAEARNAIEHWKVSGDRAALVAKLTAMAAEGEGQGRVLGNPLLTEVSTRLATFVALFARAAVTAPDAKAAVAIALHLDAMIVALDGRPKPAIDEPGRTLLTNLELTRRTLTPR
jgi:hypothetical protein